MNLLELQQRANLIVEKVNQYEADLEGKSANEQDLLNQHKYADIFCLRPVMKLLFGATVEEKLNRTLDNDVDLRLFASTAPAWNSSFKLLSYNDGIHNNIDFKSDQHQFVQNIDMMNNYNMLQLDVLQNTVTDRDDRIKQGINFAYSANIADALVTESQVANIFNWNTTNDIDIKNNTITNNRQVPGIVCYYLGNDYNNNWTATVPFVGSTLNSIIYRHPAYYGAFYDQNNIEQSQVQDTKDYNRSALRMFLPGMTYTRGRLISPQQIWQPDKIVGSDNINKGYNWQGRAVYHELVFKKKRDVTSDFTPDATGTIDNDPQGFATRLALAKQRQFYYNRPWFNELNSLTIQDTSKLVDDISSKYVAPKDRYSINTDIVKVGQGNPTINSTTGIGTNFTTSNYFRITSPVTQNQVPSNPDTAIQQDIFTILIPNFTSSWTNLTGTTAHSVVYFYTKNGSAIAWRYTANSGTWSLETAVAQIAGSYEVQPGEDVTLKFSIHLMTSSKKRIFADIYTPDEAGELVKRTTNLIEIAADKNTPNEVRPVNDGGNEILNYDFTKSSLVTRNGEGTEEITYNLTNTNSDFQMNDEQFYKSYKLDYDTFTNNIKL